MAQEPACIVNSLFELALAGIWVADALEQEWVSTPLAHIFVVCLATGNPDVVVPAEKAGQRMGDMRDLVPLLKNRVTAASARRAGITGDS